MATETSSMRRSGGRAMRWSAFAVLTTLGLALDSTTALLRSRFLAGNSGRLRHHVQSHGDAGRFPRARGG
jgi:hypothetical protein